MEKIKEKTLFQEVAESVLKELEIKEAQQRVKTNTLELGLDVKILPPPTGIRGIINKYEGSEGLFPRKFFSVYVWESDDEPLVHVTSNGWDIAFYYESGDLCGVVSSGTDVNTFNYIVKSMKIWLEQPSKIFRNGKNINAIRIAWDSLR